MINLCDSDKEYDLEESKIDANNQTNMYQLYHQEVFSDDEDQKDDKKECNKIKGSTGHRDQNV